ncbi:MAG: thioredoxin-dependent thiol peroxidase [Dehalococcoidia bacterium]|nr:thioredoxin-dependent thiol peroxidase [Dehalococcoidia bacterium]
MAVTLAAGELAPDFALRDQDGVLHRLADYAGRTVVLYFYPKDATPGCTTQACSLRDEHTAIVAAGAVVLGVSTDDAASHQRFRAAHALPFPLLVDEGAAVATRYGAWGEKTLYGRTSIGMTRATFVIGPDGRLLRVWKRARAADHGTAVLAALQQAAAR